MMQKRISDELALLRNRFADLEFVEEGYWIRIPSIALFEGWNRSATEVAFQIPGGQGYPGTPPYGFYVPRGLLYENAVPDNYKDSAPNQPPFSGSWGIFSWQPEDGEWRATADIHSGSNLLNWVQGFSVRFEQGK